MMHIASEMLKTTRNRMKSRKIVFFVRKTKEDYFVTMVEICEV